MTVVDEAEWLAWRAAGWTATDLARAFTGKYGGAYAVVAEKAGLVPPVEETDEMRRGKDLEPVVARMIELATGFCVVGAQTWCEHPERPELRCTLDGGYATHPDTPIFDALGPVESKTTGVDVRPPFDYYTAQVQAQLLVTGWDRGMLAVAVVDDSTMQIVDFRWRWIEADVLAHVSLMLVADELQRHLDAGKLPEPDGSDHATEVVKIVTHVAVPDADVVDLSEIAELVERRHRLKESMDVGKKELARLNNVIRDRVGQHSHGTAGGIEVVVARPRKELDEEAVLAEHPHLAKTVLDRDAAEAELGKKGLDAFKRPSGARTLTTKQIETHEGDQSDE